MDNVGRLILRRAYLSMVGIGQYFLNILCFCVFVVIEIRFVSKGKEPYLSLQKICLK